LDLRDIGPILSEGQEQVFTLSPDGAQLAFQIRQADPQQNAYRMQMYVFQWRNGGGPILVDQGGRFILLKRPAHGFAVGIPSGISQVITPKWSPDGRWIAYLRHDEGFVQVWRAATDGSGAEQITHATFDVEDFAWSEDGKAIVYDGRPGLEAARLAIEKEGLRGFKVDARYLPLSSAMPLVPDDIPKKTFVQTIGGALSEAGPSASAVLAPPQPQGIGPGARSAVTGRDGTWAWIEPLDPQFVTSRTTISTRVPAGSAAHCPYQACKDATRLFWASDGSLYFLRREGWAKTQTALYRWTMDSQPRRVTVTDDLWIGCQMATTVLVCARESSTSPRSLIAIDLVTGQTRLLFDPNPVFGALQKGRVERLHLTNRFGLEEFADLVYPVGYIAGQSYPMVVVQYRSRGFLRAGTGNDTPIQALAARGYAVLSFDCGPSVGTREPAKSWKEVLDRETADWSERQSIDDALVKFVDSVVARGIADPAKLGITGFSDGSTTVQYALIHHRLFKAAAVTNCCFDAPSINSLNGEAISKWFVDMGLPLRPVPDLSYWRAISLQQNAAEIRTPLLMQLADREYLGALDSFYALKANGQPVDLYVFPDETHIRWQPAHQLATYERTLDWFDFWLLGKKDPSPEKAAQYVDWEGLRSRDAGTSNGQR